MGRKWISIEDSNGQRRLDHPTDFVRTEIELALSRKIPVVPLLAHGITMPTDNELPDSIKQLAFRNATTIRPDPDFHKDMDRLISGLEKINSRPGAGSEKTVNQKVAESQVKPPPDSSGQKKSTAAKQPKKSFAGYIIGVILVTILISAGWLFSNMKDQEVSEARKAAANALAKSKAIEEEARRKAEIEAEARRKMDEEEARRKAEIETTAKLKREAEAKRKAAEEDARRKAEIATAAKLKREAEAKRKAAAIEQAKREEAARKKAALNPETIQVQGITWMAENLNIETKKSVCWGNKLESCTREGRLYTWQEAKAVCQLLGKSWYLPTDKEWRSLTQRYGGASGDVTKDDGLRAFALLARGGKAGFNAGFGGKRFYFPDKNYYAYYDFGKVGYYWANSGDGKDKNNARIYTFRGSDKRLLREAQTSRSYASVRCVSNTTSGQPKAPSSLTAS